jgi:hypothetical protein
VQIDYLSTLLTCATYGIARTATRTIPPRHKVASTINKHIIALMKDIVLIGKPSIPDNMSLSNYSIIPEFINAIKS